MVKLLAEVEEHGSGDEISLRVVQEQPQALEPLHELWVLDQPRVARDKVFLADQLGPLLVPRRRQLRLEAQELVERLALLPDLEKLRDARQREAALLQAIDDDQPVDVDLGVVADAPDDPGRRQEGLG